MTPAVGKVVSGLGVVDAPESWLPCPVIASGAALTRQTDRERCVFCHGVRPVRRWITRIARTLFSPEVGNVAVDARLSQTFRPRSSASLRTDLDQWWAGSALRAIQRW